MFKLNDQICSLSCRNSPARRTVFPAYFRLSPLQKHVRLGGGFVKKSCVSTGVRKPGKHMCVTDRNDITLAVKVALNLNTTKCRNHCRKRRKCW